VTSPLSVDQWQLFLHIAECGSLTVTAAARDVAQSAISRQLGAIERACGGKLFERTARGVRLNEIGQRLYPRVKTWVTAGQLLTEDATGLLREPVGAVRIGIIDSLAESLCGPIHAEMERLFPKVRLHLVSGMSGRVSARLENGELDIALFSENTRGRSGRGDGIARMPHVLISAPGDALTAAETIPFDQLHNMPLVIPGRPYAFHNVLEHWAGRRGIQLNIRLECDSLNLQKKLVSAGGIYAIVGMSAIRAEVARHELQAARIVQPSLDRNIVLRLSSHAAPTEACQAVHAVVSRHVKQVLPTLTQWMSEGHQP
jgi:LysR family nitrogen assimilation transcriptional regulator